MNTTTYIDRNGELSIIGSFNFHGSLKELRKLINNTIKEHGEDTTCRFKTIGRFPHRWDSHIILENKK